MFLEVPFLVIAHLPLFVQILALRIACIADKRRAQALAARPPSLRDLAQLLKFIERLCLLGAHVRDELACFL